MVKYVLHKNPIDTAHNAISFLNSLNEDEIKKENIQDRVLVIALASKVVNKYHHLETVQEKMMLCIIKSRNSLNYLILYLKEDSLYFGKRKEECGHRRSIITDYSAAY